MPIRILANFRIVPDKYLFGLAGTLDEWIRRGRVQTADEMADKVRFELQKNGENWDIPKTDK
ncbi:hypothetical protein P7M32_05270 [Bisgaard Taxon 10/6]|uniref:Uncharacterized protein n=1 Tax=Exercitatus varius TaxID=67857 RepID=A0ABT6EQK7_9PAST|nr:hypothetical protein [Exercitatus varius]MDG2938964.1 hypothetical protein [Exercitatus varius]MDG2945838.1 hypothetical protein [Exercitatus varius]MDG2951657.1 hypothetical protein [Exercitatus varius]QOF68471.1 hypothetical protein IFE17_03590 [Actinobacillus sp. GY-402]